MRLTDLERRLSELIGPMLSWPRLSEAEAYGMDRLPILGEISGTADRVSA
jgi:hypothetical protein